MAAHPPHLLVTISRIPDPAKPTPPVASPILAALLGGGSAVERRRARWDHGQLGDGD